MPACPGSRANLLRPGTLIRMRRGARRATGGRDALVGRSDGPDPRLWRRRIGPRRPRPLDSEAAQGPGPPLIAPERPARLPANGRPGRGSFRPDSTPGGNTPEGQRFRGGDARKGQRPQGACPIVGTARHAIPAHGKPLRPRGRTRRFTANAGDLRPKSLFPSVLLRLRAVRLRSGFSSYSGPTRGNRRSTPNAKARISPSRGNSMIEYDR